MMHEQLCDCSRRECESCDLGECLDCDECIIGQQLIALENLVWDNLEDE